MRINLIGMILNAAGKRAFDDAIVDDRGKPLDAIHSLDFMIMEYARVRNGGESKVVVLPREILDEMQVQVGSPDKALEKLTGISEQVGMQL